MALLQLERIGKIYAQEGTVAVGIRGVNLSFEIGEFVAVTGKSGCGKTTLLNVISGQDTYEEGELYIQGEPTSHFTQKDWEDYRREYIAFIFQDYNIIESFTVLQNVELALTRIDDPKERRRRALKLIDRVGLTPFLKHKGSHLSGGQKQRTVIARALAKDSPIILADEPTGNLDSKSAAEIVALLAEIAKDKLLIMVTHNYDDVAAYATRHIRVYDGAIETDEILTPGTARAAVVRQPDERKLGKQIKEGIRLGINRFAAKPKLSVFTSAVLLFACVGLLLITALCRQMASPEAYGVQENLFVPQTGRMIVCRQDGYDLDESDFDRLAQIADVRQIVQNDMLLDRMAFVDDGAAFFVRVADTFDQPRDGSAPCQTGEINVLYPIYMQKYYGDVQKAQGSIDRMFGEGVFTCVGVKPFYDTSKNRASIVMSAETFREKYLNILTCGLNVLAENQNVSRGDVFVRIDPTLERGVARIVVPKQKFDGVIEENYLGIWEIYIEGYHMTLNSPEIEFKDYGDDAERPMVVYMSRQEIETLLDSKDMTRASLFFADDASMREAIPALIEDGYVCVASDATYVRGDNETYMMMKILSVFLWIAFLVTIVFVSVLTLGRAVLSTQGDIAIFRSMGVDDKSVKISQHTQLVLSYFPAYVGMLITAICVYTTAASRYFAFLHAPAYLLIFFGGLLASVAIAARLNHRMYKKTVRKNLRRDAK